MQGEIIPKKYMSAIFIMRYPYMKFQDDISNQPTDLQTSRNQYTLPTFSKYNQKISIAMLKRLPWGICSNHLGIDIVYDDFMHVSIGNMKY